MFFPLFLFLYRILFLLALPILLIAIIIRSKNHPEYRHRLFERLGIYHSPLKTSKVIIHAASVGEVLALKPLVEKLITKYGKINITFTCFTPTGSAQISKIFGSEIQHCYLPLDLWPCTFSFLNKTQPELVIFMETEIWPNLLAQCKKRKIKTMIVNGRLSAKSMKQYKKLSGLISPSLQNIDQILCQSNENTQNFLTLGANIKTCITSGNLKFDISASGDVTNKQQQLSSLMTIPRQVVLMASSHQGDEERLLLHYKKLKTQFQDLLFIIVPRHPERFEYVATLAKDHQLKVAKRSKGDVINHDVDIWLIDTLGELLAVCTLANIVVMGGSFSTIGGHNPLEPALFEKAIVVGPDMSNFNEVMQQLRAEQAIIEIDHNKETLLSTLQTLLSDTKQQKLLGSNALKVVENNQGASDKTIAAIARLVDKYN